MKAFPTWAAPKPTAWAAVPVEAAAVLPVSSFFSLGPTGFVWLSGWAVAVAEAAKTLVRTAAEAVVFLPVYFFSHGPTGSVSR